MTKNQDRFAGTSVNYAKFRPSYPSALLAKLVEAIAAVEADPTAPVIDVGSGTGIFTRQLAASLPGDIPIVGVEPLDEMRDNAKSAEPGAHAIAWIAGSAETLPAAVQSVRAVTAATAAHWFDRPVFYAEAARVLVPGGVLAIIEYERDAAGSKAPAAVVSFLMEQGAEDDFARPDYVAELSTVRNFSDVTIHTDAATLMLTPDELAGLVLSSSRAKPALGRLGRSGMTDALIRLAEPFRGQDGLIPYGYVFRLVTATRALK